MAKYAPRSRRQTKINDDDGDDASVTSERVDGSDECERGREKRNCTNSSHFDRAKPMLRAERWSQPSCDTQMGPCHDVLAASRWQNSWEAGCQQLTAETGVNDYK